MNLGTFNSRTPPTTAPSFFCFEDDFLSNLRKVDDDGISVVGDHDVELVEVAVNDALVGELQQKVDESVVQRTRIVDLKKLCK